MKRFISNNSTLLRVVAIAAASGLLCTEAQAGSRSSAAYSIPTEAIGAGGGRSASAAYVNEGHIGELAGIANASGNLVERRGYAGQLYQPAALIVTASSTNVNEGTTRQLGAVATMDDETIINIPAAQVAWSVASGPITSVSGAGLAQAGIVFVNSNAVVRGTHLGAIGDIGLHVVNVNNDDYGLYAGDSLDDAWQVGYFGIGNPNAAPGLDPDADGYTTGQEYVTLTVPTDGNSYFRLRIEREASPPHRPVLAFTPRYDTRSYTPEYAEESEGAFAPLVGASTADAGPLRLVTDLHATNSMRLYRVLVSP